MALVPQVAVVSGLRNSIMNIDMQADLANYSQADVIIMQIAVQRGSTISC